MHLRGWFAPTNQIGLCLPSPVGIERVPEAVADEVDAHDGQEDHQARRDGEDGKRLHLWLRVLEQVAPGGGGRLHAVAQVAQARLGDDGGRHQQAGLDHDRPNRAW